MDITTTLVGFFFCLVAWFAGYLQGVRGERLRQKHVDKQGRHRG